MVVSMADKMAGPTVASMAYVKVSASAAWWVAYWVPNEAVQRADKKAAASEKAMVEASDVPLVL